MKVEKNVNIVNLGYRSTNYYAIDIKDGFLLVDCGWPAMMSEFAAVAKRKGVDLREIKYHLATHYHMDHAGLAQELKNLGSTLILMESQVSFPEKLGDFLRPKGLGFTEITEAGNLLLKFSESRAFLASLGLAGEITPTPGHSDDHITLLLDDGSAFTGDLPPRSLITDDQTELKESWDRIYQHNITRLYPAHGN